MFRRIKPVAGPQGAAVIFGPQQGSDPKTVIELDQGLHHFATILEPVTGVDLLQDSWGGSGGGLAGGLRAVCGAQARNGVDLMADLYDLDVKLRGQDLVIVGEESLDMQSLMSKTPIGIARALARRAYPLSP